MSQVNPYETLLKIGEEINSIRDINLLLDRVMDAAIETISAERGFILLKKNGKDRNYEVVTARNMSNGTISSIRDHSSSVVNQVLEEGEAVLSFDAQSDDRFSGAESVILQKIKSVACTPLLNDKLLLGAIYMDSQASANQFNQETLKFLNAFAGLASTAIINTRMFEQLQSENKKLKNQMSAAQLFPEIIGKSNAMLKIFDLIRDVADTSASVLITGKSGTGKELIARALHMHSSRNKSLFIPIFCGSLSENLLESELFGHKKGAFTGATEHKCGLFEEADKGTVFLDEIGEISPTLQTKLLRIIQEGELKRVGETHIRKVDVRIISATNKDLLKEVEKGGFREDLYYRLNVITIDAPALQDRREDIPLLADHFFKMYSRRNSKNISSISTQALQYLQSYNWPGNVRELENAVERAVILCKEAEIGIELFTFNQEPANLPVGKTLKEINKYAILKTMDLVHGNRTKAAEILGVSRRWLQYQLKELDLINGN